MTTSIAGRLAEARARLTAPGAPFELTTVRLGDRDATVYKNASRTLPEFIEAGRQHGDKEFMVYEGDRWSFDRFFAAVDALAWQLREGIGLKPGDRVAIAMRNRPEWAVTFAASALVGAVPAPVNSFGLRDELLAAIGDVQPRVVFVDADRLARVGDGLAALDCAVVLCDGEARADAKLLSLRQLVARRRDGPPPVQVEPDDPGLLLFTSGATSQPKGVLSSQRAVCQALANIDYIGALAALTSPAAVAALMQRGIAPTTLTAVPLFHVSGLHAQLLSSLRNGRRLVFIHRWEPARAIELIAAESITQFNGAPSMVMQLIAETGFDDPAVRRSLGGIGFGGAGLPQRLIDDVLGRLQNSMSGVGFGLTETNGVGAALSGEGFACKPRSSGVVSPLVELRIADHDGSPLPTGQPGEVWLRGVTVMQGYLNQQDATANALTDGWFRSGDIGYLDDEGFLFIVDRLKDVINRSGEKIAAAEVESCLLQHAGIAEAAVIARPDEATGEAVVAVVVARPGIALQAEDVRAHVASRLAPYKVPTVVHLRSEKLPRNPAGKLLKAVLKREYAGS